MQIRSTAEVTQRAREAGLPLLFLTVDIENDPRWDLSKRGAFHTLMALVRSGDADALIMGPPCSTWSKARSNRRVAGARPVRSRADFPWGWTSPGRR